MKLGLQLRLKQTLAPQLIQSLKMLQMPILQLEQTLRHELSINPMLEDLENEEPDDQLESTSEIDLEEGDNTLDPQFDKNEEQFERTPVTQKTLTEHLMEQLSYLKLTEEEQLIGEYVIGNISPKGYLVCTVEEMASELEHPTEKIEKIVNIIHDFDPPGVGSQDLRESLLRQIEEKGLKD